MFHATHHLLQSTGQNPMNVVPHLTDFQLAGGISLKKKKKTLLYLKHFNSWTQNVRHLKKISW